MIDIYLILAWSSLPYHENYVDQYVKTKQSDEFHHYKIWLSPNQKASTNDLSNKKYVKMHYWEFSPVFW